MKIAFTVCNRQQLSHALCLGQSLLRHNPDRRFIIGWVDPTLPDTLPDWLTLIRVEDLAIPDWSAMIARYFDFELVAACKPFFARHILENHPACTELMYLAPTVWVLGALNPITQPDTLMQLTPHRLKPIARPGQLDDKRILNMGMYHAGSWIIHPTGQEKVLLDWWCERTPDRAYLNLCRGMCLDQLWMNYLPILYSGISIVRNSGWHYGLHAVLGTAFSKSDAGYSVDGQPLITLDFAGMEDFHPIWSVHMHLIDEVPYWQEIRVAYRKQLKSFPLPRISSAPSAYGHPATLKSFRRERKQLVTLLKSLVGRIERYDLTHNYN